MLVDNRRGLVVSGCLLAGAVLVTLLYLLPETRPAVQAVDDAVWRFAVAVENDPATAVAKVLSWLGSGMVRGRQRGPDTGGACPVRGQHRLRLHDSVQLCGRQ